PDRLGLALNPNHRQATSWSVLGAQGGVYASGVSGSLTGRAADVLLIDDPFKNQQQADSAREREKVWEWWTSVAQTR
ncbi:phage terminase large subunit, partial [Streptococcus pyogenes]